MNTMPISEGPIEMAKSASLGMETYKLERQAELRKCLECPVCYKYMVSVIEECINGHCICADCRKNVRLCPQCRSNFTGQRNRLAEEMSAILIFPCQNSDVGCSAMLSGKELKYHHTICHWRMYGCYVHECKWTGRSDHILDHFKSEHRANLLMGKSHTIIWKNVDFEQARKKCYLMETNEGLFVCIQEVIHNKFAVIVQFIGLIDKASIFQYKWELMARDGGYQAVFKLPVMDDTKTSEIIFKSGGGLQLETKFIKTYFVDNMNKLIQNLEVIHSKGVKISATS